MKNWTSQLAALFATLALVACGSGAGISPPEEEIDASTSTQDASGGSDTGGQSVPDVTPFDGGTSQPNEEVTEGKDTGDDPDEPDTSTPDEDVPVTPGDAGADVADDVAADPCSLPSPVGCGCEENADCKSGYCVPTGEGNECTEPCESDCPDGWACAPYDGGDGVSTTYLCLPLHASLCRPCETGADCKYPGADIGGYCLDAADGSGSFCGATCGDDNTCPEGYSCDLVTDSDGVPIEGNVSNCVPIDAVCDCNPKAIKDGASTTCYVGNAFGTCPGTRYCDLDGLTECVSDEPASEEVCDGEDNNCDGLVDEGFENLDGDDWADCVDDDDDGDGTPDEEDNCPGVAGDQTDTDGDGFGDVCDEDDDGDGTADAEDCGPLDPDYQCTIYYYDEDGDGFGKCAVKQCLCEPEGAYTVEGCEVGSETEPSTNDCLDTDDTVNPGAAEICDLKDNDCDGISDNPWPDAGKACDGADADSCKAGTWICNDTQDDVFCDEQPGDTADEVCDGEDNDCDGLTDEADDGSPLTQSCYSGIAGTEGVGTCTGGTATCEAGSYGECAGEVTPQVEGCDAIDNDCDGDTDEELGETSCGIGQCEKTVQNCVDGVVQTCEAGDGATAEVCDGVDNDCDGFVDAVDFDMERPACELTEGVCGGIAKPVSLCVDGSWAFCGPDDYSAMAALYEPGVEQSCDGVDNDCDGQTDEELGQTLCGEGECQKVIANCIDGVPQQCDDFAEASDEICDGLDNDCDGDVDEDMGQTTCGVGACEQTIQNCINGTPQTCDAFEGAADEVCDGIDNDCDGLTDGDDPDMAMELCENQQGVCDGAEKSADLCVEGAWQACDAAVYTAHNAAYDDDLEAMCDGIDSNCSGIADDTFELTLLDGSTVNGVGQACGTGECAGGVTVCGESMSGIECTTEIIATDETCDTLDNNCNGFIDTEDPDLVIPDCANQEGVCMGAAKPLALCTDGAWADCDDTTYAEWSADYTPGEDSCTDAVDNDCSGAANEGCTPENVDFTFGSWMVTDLGALEDGQHGVDLVIGEVGGIGAPIGDPDEGAMYTIDFGFFSTVSP
ncbi:MAG: putative metal-binding motif-containing protein [Myxococcota bacterium]